MKIPRYEGTGCGISIVLLYACTILFSAFLLFQVQPLVGKIILPWFGGSAAVWSTCLLFFQVLLVLGYLYAHLTTRYLSPTHQAFLHIVLLAVSLTLLPVKPSSAWVAAVSGNPASAIVGLLAASIGLPYFILSTTGPLVQTWFGHEWAGAVPYRLFALSNIGSMLGLLSYPLVFEPWLPLHLQTVGWSAAYVIFALTCATLAYRGMKAAEKADRKIVASLSERPRARSLACWIAMAACPSVLLMAVTSHLTRNVAPIPLLWVLPLGLYLLSFILCFEGRAWYRRSLYLPLLVVSFAGMTYSLLGETAAMGLALQVELFCGGLFIACMICHGELAKLRPHPNHLTYFYLMMSIGGAVGGVFAVVIAPAFFNGDYELPIGMGALAVLVLIVVYRDPQMARRRIAGPAVRLTMAAAMATLVSGLALGSASVFDSSLLMARNFYGTLRVTDSDKGEQTKRTLAHGTIVHGEQFLTSQRQHWPTTYYGEHSGVAMAILASRNAEPQRVGVVGLGVGTLAAYGRRGDYYRFYEINPLVVRVARTKFTFLSDSAATTEVTLGDARQSLEHEPPQAFDVLVVDAFSGDSIPVHLLTREAFAIYFRHLKPGGILAIHITNRYLDLGSVVKLAADQYGKAARIVHTELDRSRDLKGEYESTWVLVRDRSDVFARKQFADASEELKLDQHAQLWTDDYSSIYAVFKQ